MAQTTPDANALFGWAERTYPSIFPVGAINQTLSPYTFRAYMGGHYLAVANSRVYLLGPLTSNQLQDFGPLSQYTCLVTPTATGCPRATDGNNVTAGADASYASTNTAFEYKSVTSVSFADVITKLKTTATLPPGISDTKGYVTIYVGTGDDRTQLAFLTVALYRAMIGGTTSTESMGVEIPLGTIQVNYEIYGEDNSGNAVTTSTGSATL